MAERKTFSSAPGGIGTLARAALPILPGASRLPFVAGGGGELPDVELELEAAVDREHLAAYARVCGFTLRETLPATYPFVLAFPLHMTLVTDGSFPFAPMGLVHLANRIDQHRPIEAGEALTLRVRAANLEPHPKGRTFDIVTEAYAGGELAWECTATTLRKGGGSEDARRGKRDDVPELEPAATWEVPGDTGRRYGAIAGDRNPIHLHALTARAFGFPRAIVHGMWTKARCVAALEPRLPDALTVAVSFRKPVLLPSTVAFASEAQDGGFRFTVRDAGRGTLHLDGSAGPFTAAKRRKK